MSLWSDFSDFVGAIGQTAGSVGGFFTDPAPEDDSSIILLDGSPMPGIVQSEEIVLGTNAEDIPIEARSGSGAIIHGWMNQIVRFGIRLPCDWKPDNFVGNIGQIMSGDIGGAIDKFQNGYDEKTYSAIDRLTIWNATAKKFDDKNKLRQVWTITQEMANAMGIHQVLFWSMSPRRSSAWDYIDLDVQFREFIPSTVLFETGQATPPKPPDTPAPDTSNPLE